MQQTMADIAQGRKRQCVFGAQLVRARRFYGYADGESMFIKVTVYNPRDVTKVADLLRVRIAEMSCTGTIVIYKPEYSVGPYRSQCTACVDVYTYLLALVCAGYDIRVQRSIYTRGNNHPGSCQLRHKNF